MVFSSLTFLQCFLPVCLLAHFLVPQKWRDGVLFLFSLLFYAWGEPVYVVLMLFSTALDYTCGQMVERHRGQRGAKVALLILGAQGDWEASDEEQAKFAADEAAKVDDVWSGIFGSADNSIVIPEDDGNSGFNMEGDFEGLDGEPVIGG